MNSAWPANSSRPIPSYCLQIARFTAEKERPDATCAITPSAAPMVAFLLRGPGADKARPFRLIDQIERRDRDVRESISRSNASVNSVP